MVFGTQNKNNGIMAILINYLFIGVLVAFLLEMLVGKVAGERFTFGERLFVITLWPISLMVFLTGFFNGGE